MIAWGENTNVYKVLVEKSEGGRPLERPACRWDYILKQEYWTVWSGFI
jgi:hypothetical protein